MSFGMSAGGEKGGSLLNYALGAGFFLGGGGFCILYA